MKASVVRKLARAHAIGKLEEGVEAITEHEEDLPWVAGEDLGEKLTHLMLAIRIRTRMDDGMPLGEAFRSEMSSVRELLTND